MVPGDLLGENRAGGWLANQPPGSPELHAPQGGENIRPSAVSVCWGSAVRRRALSLHGRGEGREDVGVENGMLKYHQKRTNVGEVVRSRVDGVGLLAHSGSRTGSWAEFSRGGPMVSRGPREAGGGGAGLEEAEGSWG